MVDVTGESDTANNSTQIGQQIVHGILESVLQSTFDCLGLGKKRRGRPPYYIRYPALKQTVIEYLEANGFRAQRRRRTNVGEALSMGGTLKSLKQHIESVIDGIVISRNTIQRLFHPPKKSTTSSKYYKSVVNA